MLLLFAMSKTILVCGFGSGTSLAVAEKFGAEGFRVAINARNAEKLEAGVKALAAKKIEAKAFPGDCGDPAAIERVVKNVSETFGPITILQWTAYGSGAGDLLTAPIAELRGQLGVALDGLLTAIRTSLPDLEKQKGESAILVTNGGFGYSNPHVDAMCAQYNAMGLGIANASKHKLVGMLNAKLADRGVYVGEVTIMGAVKGTPWDDGNATIEASSVSQKFWDIYKARKDVFAEVK